MTSTETKKYVNAKSKRETKKKRSGVYYLINYFTETALTNRRCNIKFYIINVT